MATTEDAEVQLKAALAAIGKASAQMQRALQVPQPKLLQAIKQAASMLGEMRTHALPPRLYYEIYNLCFDSLTGLQVYLHEDHKYHHLADVYEIVEYTANVLPRLYLMITVGSVLLPTGDVPCIEVLKDMLEMCRGVQNPLHGLFLRYYLCQRTGEIGPGTKAENEYHIQFLLTNFIEMNKLWVRYQHQGPSRDSSKRFEERKQLETVVGSNILRLSQLEIVDIRTFTSDILPEMLKQVVQCRDMLAQEYVLDAIVQTFPAEFHLDTLELFLGCLSHLSPETSVAQILLASMDRITGYVVSKREEIELRIRAERSSLSSEEQDHENVGDDMPSPPASSEIADHSATAESAVTEGQAHKPDESEETGSPPSDSSGHNEDEKLQQTSEAPIEPTSPVESEAPSQASNDANADEAAAVTVEPAQTDENTAQETETNGDAPAQEPHEDEPVPSSKLSVEQAVRLELQSSFAEAIGLYWASISDSDISVAKRASVIGKFLELVRASESEVDFSAVVEAVANDEAIEASADVEKFVLSIFEFSSTPEALDIFEKYPALLTSQSRDTQLLVAARVIDAVLADDAPVSDLKQTSKAFDLFSILIRSGEFDANRLATLAQLIPLLSGKSPEETLQLLQMAESSFRVGSPAILEHVYPVIIFCSMKLLRPSLSAAETQAEQVIGTSLSPECTTQILQFCFEACLRLSVEGNSPLNAFRQFITVSFAANVVGAEEACYELFAQALTVYEEQITDSLEQNHALAIAVNNLQQFTVFTTENYITLSQNITKHAQHLLKKPDQCKLLIMASHLFWDNQYADGNAVVDLLQKAKRAADSVLDKTIKADLQLRLLDAFLYFFQNDVITVNASDILGVFNTLRAMELSEHEKSRAARISSFISAESGTFPRFQDISFA